MNREKRYSILRYLRTDPIMGDNKWLIDQIFISQIHKPMRTKIKGINMGRKTVFFEDKWGEEISKFASTRDVDKYVEKRSGKKLEIKRIDSNLVSRSGNIFKIVPLNKKNKFRRMLGLE